MLWSIFIILPTIRVSTPNRADGNVAYFRYLPGRFINANHYSIMCGIRFSLEPSFNSGSHQFIQPTLAQKVRTTKTDLVESQNSTGSQLDENFGIVWKYLHYVYYILSRKHIIFITACISDLLFRVDGHSVCDNPYSDPHPHHGDYGQTFTGNTYFN